MARLAMPVAVVMGAVRRRHGVARLRPIRARQATPAKPPTASDASAWFTEPAW